MQRQPTGMSAGVCVRVRAAGCGVCVRACRAGCCHAMCCVAYGGRVRSEARSACTDVSCKCVCVRRACELATTCRLPAQRAAAVGFTEPAPQAGLVEAVVLTRDLWGSRGR
jgi:hypothetical protein